MERWERTSTGEPFFLAARLAGVYYSARENQLQLVCTRALEKQLQLVLVAGYLRRIPVVDSKVQYGVIVSIEENML